jgi:RpiB/LacA/LacB family sugar-phosphate isomerase
MKRFIALTAIVLLSAGFVSAGPLVPKDLRSDTKWFGHVDFEAVRSLKLLQDFKDKCPVYQKCQAKMQELAKKLGMNPMEDVLGATLYSNRYGGHVGVCLVYVKKLDQQKMVSLLKEKHPDYKTSEYGSLGNAERGILVSGMGFGLVIAANKFPGVRAVLCHDEVAAEISRRHFDCNVLCLSSDLTAQEMLRRIVETWLTTPFEGGRHARRLEKIARLEEDKMKR